MKKVIALNRFKNIAIFIFFLIAICIINFTTITSDKLTVSGDGLMYFLSKDYLKQCILEGVLPLWNPYSSIGTPFLADIQQSVLSPFNVLYIFFNAPLAFNLSRIIQLILAGYYMYLYMTELCKKKCVGVIVGLCFAFSTMLGGRRIEHSTIIATICFFPIILYYIEKVRSTCDVRWLIISSVCMAIQFLCGFTQVVLYFDIILIFYLISVLRDIRISFLSAMKSIVIWGGIYFLLISIQLLPTLQLMLQSGRNDIPWETFSVLAYDLRILLMMFIPNIYMNQFTAFGDYASSGIDIEIYIGIVCLIYIVYALIYQNKNRIVRLISYLSLVSFFFGMAPNIPVLGKIIYCIPVLNSFRACARSLPIFIFFCYVLFGLGLKDLWIEKERKNIIKVNLVICFGVLSSGLVLLSVLSQEMFDNLKIEKGYLDNLGNGIIVAVLLCVVNGLFVYVIHKRVKKEIYRKILLGVLGVIIVADVSRYSLIYLNSQENIDKLLDSGMNQESEALLDSDTKLGYRSFAMIDSPEEFATSNTLDIAKYGRSMHSKNILYNSWLTFLDNKLEYWGIKESVYYPNFISMINNKIDLISMLGIHYIFDAWNHDIELDMPSNNIIENCLSKTEVEIKGTGEVSATTFTANWIQPNSCYKISFELDGVSSPGLIYVDFYGEYYDNSKQDAMFANNDLGEKTTYIFVDDVPSNDIMFRIVSSCEDDLLVSNLRIDKVETLPSLQKVSMANPSILVYENLNANNLIYAAEEVVPIGEFGTSWDEDGLDNVDVISYVEELESTYSFEKGNTSIDEIQISHNSVSAYIKTDTVAFINHSQLAYPGWKVYVDGVEQKLYTVNNLIQGVVVQEGEHKIEFKFEPQIVKIGAFLTLSGVGMTILFLIREKKRGEIKSRTV